MPFPSAASSTADCMDFALKRVLRVYGPVREKYMGFITLLQDASYAQTFSDGFMFWDDAVAWAEDLIL